MQALVVPPISTEAITANRTVRAPSVMTLHYIVPAHIACISFSHPTVRPGLLVSTQSFLSWTGSAASLVPFAAFQHCLLSDGLRHVSTHPRRHLNKKHLKHVQQLLSQSLPSGSNKSAQFLLVDLDLITYSSPESTAYIVNAQITFLFIYLGQPEEEQQHFQHILVVCLMGLSQQQQR